MDCEKLTCCSFIMYNKKQALFIASFMACRVKIFRLAFQEADQQDLLQEPRAEGETCPQPPRSRQVSQTRLRAAADTAACSSYSSLLVAVCRCYF